MSTYSLDELRELIENISFNDNGKVVISIGKTEDDKYQIVRVTDDGEISSSIVIPDEARTILEEIVSRVTEFSSDGGTATGGSQITLVDTDKNWETDMWKGAVLEVYSEADSIYYLRTVSSNTSDTITISSLPAGKSVVSGDSYALRLTIGLVDIDKFGGTSVTGRDISLDIAKIGDDTYTTPTHSKITVGNTTGVALAANANAIYRLFENISDENISIALGTAAVDGEGIVLVSKGSYEMSKKAGNLYTGAVNAICASGGKSLSVLEGV